MDIIKILFSIIDWFLMTVVLKMIISRFVADSIVKFFSVLFKKNERKFVIWSHYEKRALKNGHSTANVLNCRDGKCAIL